MSNQYLGSLSKTWSKGGGVKFSKNITAAFVQELAEKAQPYGFRVYVTSAYRSPADQARVVCNNVQNTNGSNLSVYGETTQGVYRQYCPSNMRAIVNYETKKLAKNIARDPNYQGHGTGYAIDLSVGGMNHSTKKAYKKLIESMGAVVLWEKHPEHFHVWLKTWKPKVDYGWTKVLAYSGAGTSLGLTSYLVYLVGIRKGWWPNILLTVGSPNEQRARSIVDAFLFDLNNALQRKKITSPTLSQWTGIQERQLRRMLNGKTRLTAEELYFLLDSVKDLSGEDHLKKMIWIEKSPTDKTTTKSKTAQADLLLFSHNYSAKELGKLTGINERTLRRMLNNDTKLPAVTLFHILDEIGKKEGKNLLGEWQTLMEEKYA